MAQWQFNEEVASIFDQHARQHIPDYIKVLELSMDLCRQRLHISDSILEIGCATGETVKRLREIGYTDIHAVDYSQAMLDACPKDMATYYCTADYPKTDTKFDMVLCNWTLHFIQDKFSYLECVYHGMNPGGMLILSEKTENSGYALEQYHLYKERQGVSREDIEAKAASLKGVMFPESAETHLSRLRRLGFREVYIASANWCFTTFVAIK